MRPSRAFARRALHEPTAVGPLMLPPPVIVGLAAIGGVLLLVVALSRWATPSDEHAYWLAARNLVDGLSIYDIALPVGTPYAYWYPPPLAQALAPLTPFLSDIAFTAVWTVLLLGCLLFLADWRLLVALAMIAFLPVAVELWYRNVHLVLAALVVLALRRHPLFWVPAAAIKITPVLGLLYLLSARRYREALLVGAIGSGVLVLSVLVSPGAWGEFIQLASTQGASAGASLVPLPFPVRLLVAAVVVIVAGRLSGRRGEVLLVVALVIGNPTLWVTAFSLLIAIVPLMTTRRAGAAAQP